MKTSYFGVPIESIVSTGKIEKLAQECPRTQEEVNSFFMKDEYKVGFHQAIEEFFKYFVSEKELKKREIITQVYEDSADLMDLDFLSEDTNRKK